MTGVVQRMDPLTNLQVSPLHLTAIYCVFNEEFFLFSLIPFTI